MTTVFNRVGLILYGRIDRPDIHIKKRNGCVTFFRYDYKKSGPPGVLRKHRGVGWEDAAIESHGQNEREPLKLPTDCERDT